MLSQKSKTAISWDSFRPSLEKVLKIIQPSTILEYGPGVSTKIMAMAPSVTLIDSIESDEGYYNQWRWSMPDNVDVIFQPNLELYPETPGRCEKYDFIFVDGRERESCLYVSRGRLNEGGCVMLHDAERESYKPLINTFKYKFYTDDYHTVTLTDSSFTAMRLEALYA